MIKTMESTASALVPTTYTQLTEELYAAMEGEIALGAGVREVCGRRNVALGTFSSRRHRDAQRQQVRNRIEDNVKTTLANKVNGIAQRIGEKLDTCIVTMIDEVDQFRRLARVKAREAKSVADLKTASECYVAPMRMVIDTLAMLKEGQVENLRQPNVTVQVGLPSRRDEVIDVSPALNS